MGQREGLASVVVMAWSAMWGRIIPKMWRKEENGNIFVNAAVVEGWEEHKVKNSAVVLQN